LGRSLATSLLQIVNLISSASALNTGLVMSKRAGDNSGIIFTPTDKLRLHQGKSQTHLAAESGPLQKIKKSF